MSRARILIVEDEAIVARDLRQQLTELGYLTVADTGRGEEVLRLARETQPDLVLMDVHLAGAMDGIEAAQQVRDSLGLPVVFLTAFAGDETLDRAKRVQPSGYIVKPFEERELRTVIEMALYKHAAESELRQSREERAAIVRAAMDGFWLADNAGKLLDVNEAYCRMSGYPREALLTMNIEDLDASATLGEVAERIGEVRRTGVARFQRQHRGKGGRIFDVEVSVNHVAESGGRLFCFIRDNTQQRRAEREREVTVQLLQLVNDASDLLGLLRAVTWRLRDWSECEAIGVRVAVNGVQRYYVTQGHPAEFKEHNCAHCGPPPGSGAGPVRPAALRCLCEAVLTRHFGDTACAATSGGSLWTNAALAPGAAEAGPSCHPDGYESVAVVPLCVRGAPIGVLQFADRRRERFTAEGVACFERLADHLAIAIAHRQAHEETLRSEAKFRSYIEYSPLGLMVTDDTGRYLEVNPAAARMMGYTQLELLGGMTVLDIIAPEGRAVAAERLVSLRERGAARGEAHIRRKDGGTLWTSVVAVALEGGRYLAFHTDITAYKQAQEELRQSEQRFRSLLQNVTNVAVQGYAADGTTQYWNNASELLYGYTAAEAIGRNLLDLIIPPEMRDGVKEAVRQMVATGEAIPTAELSLMRKDGSRVSVYSSHTLVQLPGRDPELFCIDVDLSERRQTEEALRQSEAKFARVFQHSPVMLALASVEEGVFIEVNDTFLAVSGFSREEVIGRTSAAVGWVSPADRARLVQALERGRRVHDIEMKIHRKNGEPVLTLYSGELVEIGGCVRVLSAWQDITAWKRAESLLRLQGEALEAAANAIIITDRRGLIEWVNPAFTAFTGYTAAEAVGRRMGELLKSGEHDAAFYRNLWETILAGKVWRGEIVNRRKDGTHYTEDMTVTPVNTRGEVSHFIAVKQDITQRLSLEQQFRHAQKMEAIGQLAGGVAHDFNNILAAVLMYIGILQDEPTTDPHTCKMLKELEKEVQRGATLTRQLLTFSRQQAIETKVVNLNEVIAGLIKMLRRLLGEDIAIAIESAPGLPSIEADAGMLEQVITNLCVNARDAMQRGGRLVLHTEAVELAAPREPGRAGHFVRLDVADTGSGMDAKTQQRIFEPFFTTKPVGRGTGLGLATVYGIVKQHHGWVEVDSEVGRGTTFRIFLPTTDQRLPASLESESAPPMRGHGESILVAEDEVNVRTVLTLALRQNGYRVVEAGTGPEALAQWREHRGAFDLLLTDMVMPGGMNGRELVQRLREERPDLRVILCTGYSQVLLTEPAEDDGRTVVLRKPFGAPRLLSTVRRSLDHGHA